MKYCPKSVQMTLQKNATLWMGDVEQYMDEKFVENAFVQCGENIVSVKLMRNRTPGCANYCFVEFPDQDHAQRALLKLNGKVVPNSSPVIRFKLNHSSYGKEHLSRPEYSLFVGDLTEDVDDLALYTAFSKKFSSIRGAKVVHDVDGKSRGYGFVRFLEETDQQRALVEMNLSRGIGKKLIRVSLATPKRGFHHNQGSRGAHQQSGYHGNQYNQSGSYDQYYNYWQQYPSNYYNAPGSTNYTDQQYQDQQSQSSTQILEEEEIQDPEIEIDVEKANKEFMERSEELYTALEGSRWHPLDNVMSPIVAPLQ